MERILGKAEAYFGSKLFESAISSVVFGWIIVGYLLTLASLL